MRRREFLGAVAAPLVAGPLVSGQAPPAPPAARKGKFKQGVTRGVFGRGANFEDSCRAAATLGIKGFDLIRPEDWPTLKKYGLTPSMYPGGPGDGPRRKKWGLTRSMSRGGRGGKFPVGRSHKDTHAELIPKMNAAIDEA